MKTKITGELYGNTLIDVEIDVSKTTALVGPYIIGRPVLQCIYQRAMSRIGRSLHQIPGLICDVEKEDYVAIYVDAYRMVSQLYEIVIQDKLESIKQNAEFIRDVDDISIRGAGDAIYRAVEDIQEVFDLMYALEMKNRADELLVAEAVSLLNKLYEEWTKKIEEEFRDLFDDFFPLVISATVDGFVWTDRKTGALGRGLQHYLSTAFSPALVVLYAIYAYGISQKETYLLIEEPEAHAHPWMAYFLGTYLRKLVQSNSRLNIVVATQSFGFLNGFINGGKVYIIKRDVEGKVLLKAKQWQSFSDINKLVMH